MDHTEGRAVLTELYAAAVAGADPGPITSAALADFPARRDQRILLFSVGKAAHPMAAAATAALQRSLLTIAGGLIVSPDVAPSPYATVAALQGNHPLPGRQSFTAADRIGELSAGTRGDDVAIVLLSGGASSLVAAPLRGMAESDLGQLYELLLGSGLDIRSMNRVRKRFTRWGAGRLALALAPARTHAFVISDVIGDDPADIGSGPCTADPSTVADVIDMLKRASLFTRIPAAMRDYLASVLRGTTPETPKATHPAFAHVSTRVIGSNRLAVDAARAHAAALSLSVECIGTPLSGEAAYCGARVADALLDRAREGRPGCIIWGGETTVQLVPGAPAGHERGAAPAGRRIDTGASPVGGRCQELALAAARQLSLGGDAAQRVCLLAAGTDGRDGTSDAAGAFADAWSWARIRESGRDPDLALQRHEAHAALASIGALLPARPTGTNVMDVVIGLVH